MSHDAVALCCSELHDKKREDVTRSMSVGNKVTRSDANNVVVEEEELVVVLVVVVQVSLFSMYIVSIRARGISHARH